MKVQRYLSAIYILIVVALIAGCYEGYVGNEGAMLKEYLEPAKLKELVNNPRADIWIIDVRPESAFKKAHIPSAKNFPSGRIMERLSELPKTQYLIVTCETGGRAQMVIKRLEKAGYTRFMNWGANSRYFNVYGSISE
ncbi:MAG TPA: rhodanese-like domain-containing protein [Deltaproteobacteria bacterium]|nr:rhodanese-like domain-containing protein [Deltaproteobacteria bacterium]